MLCLLTPQVTELNRIPDSLDVAQAVCISLVIIAGNVYLLIPYYYCSAVLSTSTLYR